MTTTLSLNIKISHNANETTLQVQENNTKQSPRNNETEKDEQPNQKKEYKILLDKHQTQNKEYQPQEEHQSQKTENQLLITENQLLKKDNQILKSEHHALITDNQKLKEENQTLNSPNRSMASEIQMHKIELQKLKAENQTLNIKCQTLEESLKSKTQAPNFQQDVEDLLLMRTNAEGKYPKDLVEKVAKVAQNSATSLAYRLAKMFVYYIVEPNLPRCQQWTSYANVLSNKRAILEDGEMTEKEFNDWLKNQPESNNLLKLHDLLNTQLYDTHSFCSKTAQDKFLHSLEAIDWRVVLPDYALLVEDMIGRLKKVKKIRMKR